MLVDRLGQKRRSSFLLPPHVGDQKIRAAHPLQPLRCAFPLFSLSRTRRNFALSHSQNLFLSRFWQPPLFDSAAPVAKQRKRLLVRFAALLAAATFNFCAPLGRGSAAQKTTAVCPFSPRVRPRVSAFIARKRQQNKRKPADCETC